MNIDLNKFQREVDENPSKFYENFQKQRNFILGTEDEAAKEEVEEKE
tara:strand:+ start:589 stop:729 length:141 start_codon:yes stop_codon:yes gene_type:complete